MQFDSGCTCDVMPDYCVPAGSVIHKTKSKLQTYNKKKVPVAGITQLKVTNPKNGIQYWVTFKVVKLKGKNQKPLLGSITAQKMNLSQVNDANIAYPESFANLNEGTHTREEIAHEVAHTAEYAPEIFTKYNDVFDGLIRSYARSSSSSSRP